MIFRKRRAPDPAPEAPAGPLAPPEVLETLDRLAKGGGQLTVRTRDGQTYTSAVVGLGRDAFYIDTLSPPEGDDKVLKYPLMFSVCDVLIVNKIDYLNMSDFDMKALRDRVAVLNPAMQVFEMSCKTGQGIPEWCSWLKADMKKT